MYSYLKDLVNVDLVECIEKGNMKLQLLFRIHKESNIGEYEQVINKFGGATLIQDDSRFPIIQIEFDSFIGYSILNESFTVWDDYEQFEGNIFRVFTKSRYLDYISVGTIATEEYPGPFKHYGIAALNHIVDVVSISDPVVKV